MFSNIALDLVFAQGNHTGNASDLVARVAQGTLQISSEIYRGDTFHCSVAELCIQKDSVLRHTGHFKFFAFFGGVGVYLTHSWGNG